ncbi:MAG: TauD/TfdA family dioxygenase [bacterium]
MLAEQSIATVPENLDDRILVSWSDGSESVFYAIWLRDNCHCELCGDASIGRRNLRLTDLDLDIAIKQIVMVSEKGRSDLEIKWSDGHCGRFSADWLYLHRFLDKKEIKCVRTHTPWTQDFVSNPPSLSFDTVVNDPDTMLELLHCVRDNGLCLMHNAPAKPGILETFAQKIGHPQESNFGRIQDLVADKSKRSIANDIDPLKPHTDEPYRASPPGILIFHCIETDLSGAGESIFLDGFSAAESLRAQDPEGFRALTENDLIFRRHFEGDVDLSTAFPVISLTPDGEVCGVRINDRVSAPTPLDPDALPAFYRGMQILLGYTEDESRWIKHALRPGDFAVFDNHRVLHGRTRLSLHGRRWLQWAQVERGDFHSALRILSDGIGRDRSSLPLPRGAYG